MPYTRVPLKKPVDPPPTSDLDLIEVPRKALAAIGRAEALLREILLAQHTWLSHRRNS